MSKHHHANRPLGPKPAKKKGRLPANQFGGLTGELDHLTLAAHDGNRPDDNHVYLWLRIPSGNFAGKFEVAFNTQSSDHTDAQYYVYEEAVDPQDIPGVGFESAEVSYTGLGLHQSDFVSIGNGTLRTMITEYAHAADLITAYGFVYGGGDGLHEVHMNSGEPAGSHFPNHVNQDGTLLFHHMHEQDGPFRRWVFLKFGTQLLA